jgi:hypothetical protein
VGAGRHYRRGVHAGTHPAVDEVSIVVSPRFSCISGTVALGGASERLEQSEIVGIFGLQGAYQDLKLRKLA